MHIEIRKLTPDLTEEYIHFFDTTPHNQKYRIKCCCAFWCNDDCEGKDFHTKKQKRDYAIQYVKGNPIQGYLAHYGGKVVGWCIEQACR